MQPPRSDHAARSGSFPDPTHAENEPVPVPESSYSLGARNASFLHHPLAREHESSLTVVDNRTGHSYNLPISQNSISATDFHQIKTPRNEKNPVEQNNAGIRIYDPGFQNTACMESKITYVDGDAGEIAYRGTPVADLFYSGRPFEHIAFLLIFGHLPNDSEATAFNTSIATSEMPPQTTFDTINNLP